ncbi:MAG: hypothetical protein H5U19_04210 [Rhodobacteraceae bacterium]|nr:hypothetical protein [Paracoccaceae bacterium]
MILKARDLDAEAFDAATLDALFDAILINDVVDDTTPLPDTITLDIDARHLIGCFRISRQLWKTSGYAADLADLLNRLAQNGDLDTGERLRFKHVRAKFKHLRFAHALYDRCHRYPVVLHWMTTAMGHLQDAIKARNARAIRREVAIVRAFLTWLPQRRITHEVNRLDAADSAGFHAYVMTQIGKLRGVLDHDAVTGAEFHATRKIISRQVSFYDDLRTIAPSDEAFAMSRALAAINGLMGQMHDDLIAEKIVGTRDYHRERFAFPDAIGTRLRALADRYPPC